MPVWLEFFAGEGGTAMGISRAGFHVICVDSNVEVAKRNPFTVVVANAIDHFHDLVSQYRPAVIGGAPPCQGYSDLRHRTGKQYPKLIEPFRELARSTGLPYVIENVETARPHLLDPILLCGSLLDPVPMVDDLLFKRHRLFESNLPIEPPSRTLTDGRTYDCLCSRGKWAGWWRAFIDVHGGGGQREVRLPNGSRSCHGNKATVDEARRLTGNTWMSQAGLNESIPWRYGQIIAKQIMRQIKNPFAA